MIPFAYAFRGEFFDSMKGGASIHNARICLEWFMTLDITVLLLAAKSPDLDPMKNVWDVLAPSIYRSKKSCTVQEQEDTLLECWNKLDQSFFNRMLSLIQFHCI